MTRTDYQPSDFETTDPEAARAERLGLTPATEQRTPEALGLGDAVELTNDALEAFLS